MYIPEYHKINSVYKRYDKGNFDFERFARPEFEYLFKNRWIGTEKIDGTNIRIGVEFKDNDNLEIEFRGRTDKAQIPRHLNDRLNEIVRSWNNLWEDLRGHENTSIVLYGEGYGNKIQKGGGNYLPDSVDFILFDVLIDGWFLERENINDIGVKLGLKVVPTLFAGTLEDAITQVTKSFDSVIGNCKAEGLVLTPSVPLFNRKGERIITKLKTRDF